MAKIRLDALLAMRGLAQSKARAADAIRRGHVSVGGSVITKSGKLVAADYDDITVSDPAEHYVSRSALKLKHGLDVFKFDPTDCVALDIGASTGGFTQVLLEYGARHVTAVDVGQNQMHAKLRTDERVHAIEKMNAKDLRRDHLEKAADFLVIDVSFISLRKILAPVLACCENKCCAVLLFKPQFEVGKDNIGKNGIVVSQDVVVAALEDFCQWFQAQTDWTVVGSAPSPISGGDGNLEYVIGAKSG